MSLSSSRRIETLTAILAPHLLQNNKKSNARLVKAIVALGEATADISHQLTNYVNHSYAGSQNASGDDQLELDLACDAAVFRAVRASGVYCTVASEETPQETNVRMPNDETSTSVDDDDTDEKEVYSLGCDPLDGSSIIDANFSVGSIYGIWPGTKLLGRTGREQVAAAVSLYGPRTLLCIALPGQNDIVKNDDDGATTTATTQGRVLEVTLVQDRSEWELSRDNIQIASSGKIFAPGNLRAIKDHEKYKSLCHYWMEEGYQLRYSGGMVPDVYHIFAKSKGIFTNVSSDKHRAKLRLLYEVAPLGFIVECAGGIAMNEDKDESVLDIVIDDCDQRLGVCFGSKEEVERYKKFMF